MENRTTQTVTLAHELVADPHFDGIGYARAMSKTVSGEVDRLVIIAEGETAKELLPVVDNFEALMEDAGVIRAEVQS